MKDRRLTLRRVKDRLFFGLLVMATLLALLPLVDVLGLTLIRGWRGLAVGFFTQLPAPVGLIGGMGNAIVGTLIMVGLAAVIAIPIGVSGGIYVAEYAQTRYAVVLRFVTDVLSGVPSILVGLLVYGIVVVAMGNFSAWAGTIALAFIMIPTITRVTEQMLTLVPVSVREGALALGASRLQTVLLFVLPASARGLMTGVVLAIARAMGETAPLIFTAFGNNFWQTGLGAPIAALPLQIFVYATSPYPVWQAQAWTGALTLVLMVIVLHALAHVLARDSKV